MPGVGLVKFVREQYKTLPIAITPQEASGRTYIVTGANVGLGFECAKHLVQLSAARVIIGVRSLSKGDAAKATIESQTGRKGVVEVWHLDLSSHQSVIDFASKIERLDRVDALIENAAVATAQYVNADGLESTLTVNVVSTMLLAALALPKLQASAKAFDTVPHIVLIGSEVAFDAKGVLEKLDPKGDVLTEASESPMALNRYPLSKLLLLYSFREFASKYPASKTGVVVNYVNPGLCVTELNRSAPFVIKTIINIMRLLVGRTAEVGSRTELHGASAGKDSHGRYLSACEVQEESYIPDWITCESGKAMQNRVWASTAEKLNSVKPGCV